MGHGHGPDGAHSHGSGSGGAGVALLVIVVVALVGSAAGPVVHAVAELVRVVLIVAAVLVGVGLLGGAALVAWRLRRGRQNAPRVVYQVPPVTQRPAASLPAPRALDRPVLDRPTEVHLHLHGVAAEDVAVILARAGGYPGRTTVVPEGRNPVDLHTWQRQATPPSGSAGTPR